jgi:hypothetical protein
MALDPQYEEVAEKLHEALLTSPATKADAATHIINTGGLTLPQAGIEMAIDLIIEDLAGELVLSAATYAALLARHQAADVTTALRVLKASTLLLIHQHEKDVNDTMIADATAEWAGLTQLQKDAVPSIKAVADEGIIALNERNAELQQTIDSVERKREAL